MGDVGAELMPVDRPVLARARLVWVSPLAGQDVLAGGRVDDAVQVAAIRSRVEFFSRPWWRRVGRRPALVAPALPLPKIIMPSPAEVAT